MAIRELDLPQPSSQPRPGLRLVAPPPTRGRPIAALLVVVLVAGVLATPVLRADRAEPPAVQNWPNPHLSGAMVGTLDDGSAIFDGSRPTSSEPVGGMLFVRCTRLWSAQPDGSHPRKLLDMTGISSPAFSPDARTVAFLAPSGDAPAIWLASAEGDDPRAIARLTTDGRTVPATPTNLTWSDNGKRLAFALVDPRFDPFGAGSSIWSYVLATGDFKRGAQGWPTPFFLAGRTRLAYASRSFGDGANFYSLRGNGGSKREGRLSSEADEYTAAFVNGLFSDSWTLPRGAVTLRDLGGVVAISVKRNEWRRRILSDHLPPKGYEIDAGSRLALAQDGSRVLVDLFGNDGQRDLGILDLRSGEWTVLDYAWDGAMSPAPTASGPLKAQRAERFAADLIGSMRMRKSGAFTLLGGDDEDRAVIPFFVRGHVLGDASRSGADWVVPASVIGKVDRRSWAAGDVRIVVSETPDGRIVTDAESSGAIVPIETVEDAVAVAANLVGERFRWPTVIPDGARLNNRWPIDAWSYEDHLTVSVNMEVPSPTGKGDISLSVVHGDVGFNMGCGGEIDPEEGTVAGQPALFDQTGEGRYDTRQVLWPATLKRDGDAFYTVYGGLSREEITRIAESMVR